MLAKILPIRKTVKTVIARTAQPGHTDPVSRLMQAHISPQSVYCSDDLMTENQWQLRILEITVPHMKIGATDPASAYLNTHLSCTRLRS